MKALFAALFVAGLTLLLWSVAQYREARNMHSFLSDEFFSARRVHVYIEKSSMSADDKRVLNGYFEDMRSDGIHAFGRLKNISFATGLAGAAMMLGALSLLKSRKRANKAPLTTPGNSTPLPV